LTNYISNIFFLSSHNNRYWRIRLYTLEL